MATAMIEAAVDKLVELGGKSVSRAMRESRIPYSPNTAKTPSKLTKRKGFQEALKKYGLTQGLITRALVSDIKAKPKKRLGELNLGADILGMRVKADTPTERNLIVVIAGQSGQRYGVHSSQESR